MTTIVGQGLAGTLLGLELERRARDFVIVDEGSGATATRAAAGLFNPLTGPRFTEPDPGWDRIVPHYRELEQRLGVPLVHPLPLVRPLAGAKVRAEAFPKAAPGWAASVRPGANGPEVVVEGGGWVDLGALLDAARARWLTAGRLEARRFAAEEGRGRRVFWCAGVGDLAGPVWGPAVERLWQPVRGDVLTVRIPGLRLGHGEIGAQFLLPLGGGLFRWGATHEYDVADQGFRPAARAGLEAALVHRLGDLPFEVEDHRWGVRPSSRSHRPLVIRHPDQPGWTLVNGFGGRGVSQAPAVGEGLGFAGAGP